MMGKLPKSEAWKRNDPDRPGLLTHPRYSSRDSLSEWELCKWNLQNVVCVLISTGRGVFIGVQGGVTDLVKSVTHQVVVGRPSHEVSRPAGLAPWSAGHVVWPPLTFSTALAFPFSCRHVCTKPWAKST
jgi:hypothetical protein